jgi:hypothetical protein
MVLLMAPEGSDPIDLQKNHAWISSRDEDNATTPPSSSRPSTPGSSDSESKSGGGGGWGSMSRLRRRGSTPGSLKSARQLSSPEDEGREGGGPAAAGPDLESGGASVERTQSEEPTAPASEGRARRKKSKVGRWFSRRKSSKRSQSTEPADGAAAGETELAALPPGVVRLQTIEGATTSGGGEGGEVRVSSFGEGIMGQGQVSFVPVGIITLEDVMEELMQVGGGVRG